MRPKKEIESDIKRQTFVLRILIAAITIVIGITLWVAWQDLF